MSLTRIGTVAAQTSWLLVTTLWLFGLLAFTHIGTALILLLGSALILGRPLYHTLVALKPSGLKLFGLWAMSAAATAVFVLLPLFWFMGLGQPWQTMFMWPNKGNTALMCAVENRPSLGEDDFRFIIGLPIGQVATAVVEQHDLSFAWVIDAKDEPLKMAKNIAVYQQQLGPYFNQAPWHRLLLWLGFDSRGRSTHCDFRQPIVENNGQ